MEQTEYSIIDRLKSGDERAYQYIYDHHYVVLCHVAEGYVKDAFLAENIVGDVIFHLWEIRASLCITTSLRNYLLQAVRNRCLNSLALKHDKYEVAFSLLLPDELFEERAVLSDEYPLGTLLAQELEQQIMQVIDSLPVECRTVFCKSRFGEETYDEIASDLGISVNTVKFHIKRALAVLRQALSKYFILILSLLLSSIHLS